MKVLMLTYFRKREKMSNWEDYLAIEHVEEVADKFNSKVAESRKVNLETLKAVLASAVDTYSYLEHEEDVANALEWDLHGFLEYSTQGVNASAEFYPRYSQLLPAGHPHFSGFDTEESVDWLLGDSSIEDSAKEVITAALTPGGDQYQKLHATVRLQTVLANGNLKPFVASFATEILSKLD